MAQKQSNPSELVSLMFVMGRFMRDKMQKKIKSGICDSLLEFETMRYIKDKGSPHMREVATNFRVTPPAATLLIDSLVKEKLLMRVLDPKDRRSVRVELTKRGKDLFEKRMAQKTNEFKRIFSTLTPAERNQFAILLKKIIKNNS
jgi:DNA-binding MarR family transcriptional regulator